MADNIETSNSFEALHYLGKTHKAQSPGKKTRLTKKKKINEENVKAALDERFAQHEQAVVNGR
jgi:hypothetical protein